MPKDSGLAGVIGGQRESDVAVKGVKKRAEMPRAAEDVFSRVQRSVHPEMARGRGHKLHEALSAFVRDR